MKIPEAENSIESLVYKTYEQGQEPPRSHMGVSQLGHPCERFLWINFRWVVTEKFQGRILKLFARGHREEAFVVSDLRRSGINVEAIGENQSRVSFGSHVSGSADGIVSLLPNGYTKKAVLECKTHSDKSFKDMVKNGLEKSKPMHWVQCHIYAYGLKLERILYYAVNKNDDSVYTEWVHLDKDLAQKYVTRGQRIALDDRMPPPLSTDPSWFECKFCPAHAFCHKAETPKEFGCRSCAHATPKEDSTWRCEKHKADDIPLTFQRKGCESGTIHPDIVPWRYTANDDYTVWHTPFGDIANGKPDANVYSASEILANPQACATGETDKFRALFNARVVG
jgi:hypothetical protein